MMFKLGRMQRKIPPWLVCGPRGACLVCMLPGVQVTARLGFVSALKSLSDSEDSDSLAVYWDLFPSSGVPSGIYSVIDR